MPTYNQSIGRTDAQALIPEDVSKEIIQGMAQSSVIMRIAKKMPNMPRNQRRVPVLNTLAQAYFVAGDTGLRQDTKMAWTNKYFNAEEIACIVPISKNVLDDVDYDIWGETKPRIIEQFGKVFDQAVLFGTNAPASWPTDIKTFCSNTSNTLSQATKTDLYDALLGSTGVFNLVEVDGFEPDRVVMPLAMKGQLRGIRDAMGQPIFRSGFVNTPGGAMQSGTVYELDGTPTEFPRNGSQDVTSVKAFVGDWQQLLWCVRMDMTWELLTEAVIQDGSGAIVFNLAQQSMVALKAEMRLAWQVPNPINIENTSESTRFPFATLTP